jgi:hypothetical protein
MEENNDEKEPEIDENGRLIFRLNPTDSALVVRANGNIEVISTEMTDHDNGYLGDIEDLNKTFSLVLALAASIEDEDLYNRIFFNLNKVLMRQWDNLDNDKKEDIIKIRKTKDDNRDEQEQEEKYKRIDAFRDRLDSHKRGMMEDMYNDLEFMNPSEHHKRSSKLRKRKSSLRHLKNVDWNAYDKSLSAHFKNYRSDDPPKEEE